MYTLVWGKKKGTEGNKDNKRENREHWGQREPKGERERKREQHGNKEEQRGKRNGTCGRSFTIELSGWVI